MSITSFDQNGTGFLHFNSLPPRIYITGLPNIPESLLLSWKTERFTTTPLPYDASKAPGSYINTLKSLSDNLSLGEQYALIAYGDAASVVLKTAMKPLAKCCAIIAFYPSLLPSPKTKFPNAQQVQIHIAGLSQTSAHPEMCEWTLYRYEDCATGFADPTSKTYKQIEAELAWSRALACVRRGFNRNVDLESVVQSAWAAKYEDVVPERGSMGVVKNMTQNSVHVTILPTMEGGVGRKKLEEFYREFFIPSLVDDFKIRLVSRTIGVDRVVDEMIVSFTHSDEVDWILPGVPPTDRFVKIPVVSIVAVKGGKLASEHMYWDQASVLMQVGLLDPKVVPKNLKSKGLRRLPVVGAEAAQQLAEPQQGRYNELLQEHGLLNGINGS